MDERRLQDILFRSARARVLVVGDFVLHRRLLIDPARIEYAEETGLPAHQVVAAETLPGAAGSIAAILRAFGTAVTTLGVIGDDGDGYELRRNLRKRGIDERAMVVAADRYTPTSIQPVIASGTSIPYEHERLDIRSRIPLASSTTMALIERLRALVTQVQAVLIVDDIPEEECGVVTRRLRLEIADLAARHRDVWFLATSQQRPGLFRQVIVMSNARECVRAVCANDSSNPPLALVGQAAEQLRQRTGKPVIVMLGVRGMLVVHEQGMIHAPSVPITGPIRPTGANDSAIAAVAAALCAGATMDEAVELGNLATAAVVRRTDTDEAPLQNQIIAMWWAYRKGE
ncbi:bifunctional heptose 7-phosphate kinase/heptose 1-phosphate adenyltransferase [Roseiflexus castenholzii]|jgi:bifunctional ADP-heptose synthase (sugar kinase/adenylyltransferase)|uniref:PfkB domain protein n=1 Tax=Roseiflexus castenholzii (strain DSM 13941 / HLO8) TaxID=383372 RepID=A7NF56_ROSCS|nr:PfkB family carbohydrate kinase [Roseiflexus castenholzii]ABU58644.1 PfkB domain protein [Roseiflexus castenholzii DSM 13941]